MPPRTPVTPGPAVVLIGMLQLSACIGGETGAPLGQDGAHEHGVADLSIVVEGTEASVVFEAPAGDILGYEGDEPEEDELARARDALRDLESDLVAMVGMPDELECRVAGVSWEGAAHGVLEASGAEGEVDGPGSQEPGDPDDHESEHEEAEGGGHADVIAEFAIECGSPLEGSRLELSFSDHFQTIEELDLQVVSSDRQFGRRVPASGSVIDL